MPSNKQPSLNEQPIPMERLLVQDIYTPAVISIPPHTMTNEALSIMREKQVSSVIIVEGKKPIGIFTERDAVRLAKTPETLKQSQISEVMSSPLIQANLDMGYLEAYGMLSENKVRHIVITNQQGFLEGLVTESDFLKHLSSEYLVQFKKVGTLMNTEVLTLKPHESLSQAIHIMGHEKFSCIVIEQDNEPVGIFTERDIVQLNLNESDPKSMPIEQVMTAPVLTASASDSISDALQVMEQKKVRRLVITNTFGKIAGLLTRHDIIRCLSGNQVHFLREKIIEQDKTLQILENQLILEKDLNRVKQLLTETQHVANIGSWELNLIDNQVFWSEETYRIFEVDPRLPPLSVNDMLQLMPLEDRKRVAFF